ncbi:hypothetical protein KUL113_04060 [Tenacibaculum sp. KUL113]|nr:hypothetical protein KUL113_04060 [Tenacibaculum sp. KUL113]
MHPELTKQLKANCQKLGLDFNALDLIGESETQIRDITIKIERDEDAESPREWDNVGKMVCWHRNYRLGDEQPSGSHEDYRIGMVEAVEPGFEDMLQRLEHNWPSTNWDAAGTKEYQELVEAKIAARLEKYYFMLPLYLYDHSGITMNTSGFSCSWDSGQVGFIYVSKERAREQYGFKRLTKERVQKVYDYLDSEVKTYASYLEGNVYGYVIEGGDIDDSCWGYVGPDGEGWALSEALAILATHKKQRVESRVDKIKTWIKNQVPLLKRRELATDLPILL